MGLFYFKCEKCGLFQSIDNDTPNPESIPHIEYPEKYGSNDSTIMVPICRICYELFVEKWVRGNC